MKFTMNTAKMNSILGRLSKGVGSSKILPITEYLKLELVDGDLHMTATDSANFIQHIEPNVAGEEGLAIVKADKFIKLISKTTKSQIDVELKDTHLEVKGNGTYKVELFDTTEYPTYEFDENVKGVNVKTALLKKAFAVNKAAIAVEMLMPCLTGYNLGSDVVTTDGVKMCVNDTSILGETRALIPQKLADLLSVLTSEDVTIQKDGNKLLFTTDSTTIFGTELEGLADYPDVSAVTQLEFSSRVVVKRQLLLDALDRLSLFVDNTTNFGVKFFFGKDGLFIEDLKEKSGERVAYIEQKQAEEDVELLFNIDYLTDLLSALSKDDAALFYANDMPLKIKEENVTLVLSTMSPE